jgi:hypothetical protein
MIGQLALICAALFAGAAVFVNVSEQPARLVLDDRAMLLQWQRSYNRAAPMQAGLAMVSALLGFIAAWQTRDWCWGGGRNRDSRELALHLARRQAPERQAARHCSRAGFG